jgi:hypothetical protein
MTITIGIDPHKASHTAVAIDNTEHVLDELRVRTVRVGCTLRELQRHRPNRSIIRRTSASSAQPRGNRQLNYAIHVAAVTQLRYPGEGQNYHQRKRAEGKSSKEATRALKRQISNAVYRSLIADAHRLDT